MNKYQEEYLGENATITKSTKKDLEGIQGKIIGETKNTFRLQTNNKTITVLKKICTFKIKDYEIEGKKITKRPEERIKITRGKK